MHLMGERFSSDDSPFLLYNSDDGRKSKPGINFQHCFSLSSSPGSILLPPEDISTAWISFSIMVWMSQPRMPQVRMLLKMSVLT